MSAEDDNKPRAKPYTLDDFTVEFDVVHTGLRADRLLATVLGRDDLLAAMKKAATWCHVGHGTFPQSGCGLCGPVLAAIAKVEERL